jgi:hypothetical protein
MVNVEADVLAGVSLAAKAHEKGVIYSIGYGDQPALVARHGESCRTRPVDHLPIYHNVTPDEILGAFDVLLLNLELDRVAAAR